MMHDNVSNSLLQNNQASLVYSYHLKLNKKYTINFAIQGGVLNKSFDLSRFQFSDQLSLSSNLIFPQRKLT